jgi:hypothetical protein
MNIAVCYFVSRVDLRIALTSWQLAFDAAESSGWTHSGRFNNMTTLLQIGLGDSTVSTIAGRIMAVNLNSSQMMPSPISSFKLHNLGVYNTTGVDVLFQFLYSKDESSLPKNSALPTSTDVHNCMQEQFEVMNQHSKFISEGVISMPCKSSVCVVVSSDGSCS